MYIKIYCQSPGCANEATRELGSEDYEDETYIKVCASCKEKYEFDSVRKIHDNAVKPDLLELVPGLGHVDGN